MPGDSGIEPPFDLQSMEIWIVNADGFDTRRQKFASHFAHLGSSLHFPSPYAQFTGKPNGRHDHVRFDARWERAVTDSTRDAVERFSSLASALRVPVLCILQPTIDRKKHLSPAEQNAGSDEFLAYLSRQYGRLEDHFRALAQMNSFDKFYSVHDLGGQFAN